VSNGNESAFPCKLGGEHTTNEGYTFSQYESAGLTKRELFAAMAMQGMISFGTEKEVYDETKIPKLAVKIADALIAELEKSK
jgi:hypothetical protein